MIYNLFLLVGAIALIIAGILNFIDGNQQMGMLDLIMANIFFIQDKISNNQP